MADQPTSPRDLVGRAHIRVYDHATGRSVMAEGWVVAYSEQPTLVLRHNDGTQTNWPITLPREVLTTYADSAEFSAALPPAAGERAADQTGRQRAIQAVRNVLERLTTIPGLQRMALASELVDAVQGAGRDDHDRFAGSALQDPDVRAGYRHDAEARGYQQAVDELRGVVQRTGSPAATWAADYLEAVGTGGTGRGGERSEQWTMRYRVNGGEPTLGDDVGHVLDSREDAERHITTWRKVYPDMTYTDVEYLRREVITSPWIVDPEGTNP